MDNNFNGQNFDGQNFNNQSFNEFNGGNTNYTPQPPVKDPGHGLAIASLVLGIISLLSCCCVYLAVPVGIVGIVLAIISKSKSNSGTMETMAKIGLALSIVGVVIAVGYIIFSVVWMGTEAGQEYMEMYQDMMNSYY